MEFHPFLKQAEIKLKMEHTGMDVTSIFNPALYSLLKEKKTLQYEEFQSSSVLHCGTLILN